MSSWNTQRKRALQRDRTQCQICGDFPGCPYTKLHVHHIIHREHGGTDDLENLITLCDLCHACCHLHLSDWMNGFPEGSGEVERVYQEFVEFL